MTTKKKNLTEFINLINTNMKYLINKLAQFKQWILSIVIPRFLCFLFGHKQPIAMLNETDYAIFTKGCPRCKTHLGMPTWKNCPSPPNSNDEQIKSWNKFIEIHYEEIRNSVNK